MSTWKPKRTLAEVDAILTAPGAVLELEDVVIDGVKYRAYKNLPKSIREEWLNTAVSSFSILFGSCDGADAFGLGIRS